ncbi:MAG TPA: TetR/AcrR family transcriptional regulator [Candidatus Atribacteria bacterium]|nr:TetR/AcrR family transcriptional regulator [Candidatus Atribacteria bacterium]
MDNSKVVVNKENQKLKQILATAQDLFFRYGIRRVTVEEICRTAGVSKMTFYKYFKNKIDLVKKLMEKIYDQAMAEYRQIMDKPIPYVQKIEETIQWKLEQQKNISQEFIKDYLSSDNEELLRFFHQKRDEMLKEILDDYSKAQEEGDIRQDLKPEFILYLLNKLTEFYQDESLLKMYGSPRELTKEVLNFFFYGILVR